MSQDPRLKDLIGNPKTPKVAIIGFPSEEGVRRNGGRVGAAQAPEEIRNFLYKLTPHPERAAAWSHLLSQTSDLGDLHISGDLHQDQELLGETLAPLLKQGTFCIVLGGGHETAYGHFLGYIKAGIKMRIVNIDAHADVRPFKSGLPHSGSPFRQALEHPSGFCESYSVAGLLPHSISQEHISYIQDKGGEAHLLEDTTSQSIETLYKQTISPLMATFDIDAVDQAFAPGVSAPATGGMHPSLWLTSARLAGLCPFTRSMDLVELNPIYDQDGQTARLAALTIWHVLDGIAEKALLK